MGYALQCVYLRLQEYCSIYFFIRQVFIFDFYKKIAIVLLLIQNLMNRKTKNIMRKIEHYLIVSALILSIILIYVWEIETNVTLSRFL